MLMKGNCLTVDSIDDEAEWLRVVNAMRVIGIGDDEQQTIFAILSAIMVIITDNDICIIAIIEIALKSMADE